MGFWLFMFFISILTPVVMIGFGRLFINYTPKNINPLFGYRTKMSMKNKDTWEFAHKHIGKVWFIVGLIILPLSVIPMFFVIGSSIDDTGIVGTITVMIQLAIMVASSIPTNRALKKTFHKDGTRK